jgi:hypothetical protein
MVHCAQLHLERGHPLQRCARSGCASMQRAPWYASSMQLGALRMRCGAGRRGAVSGGTSAGPHSRRDLWGPDLHLASATSAGTLPHLRWDSAPGIKGPTSAPGRYVHAGTGCSTICRPARIFAEADSRNATARDSAEREHLAGTQVEFPRHMWDFRATSGIWGCSPTSGGRTRLSHRIPLFVKVPFCRTRRQRASCSRSFSAAQRPTVGACFARGGTACAVGVESPPLEL